MNIQKARQILMENPEFKKAYNSIDLPLEVSKILTGARIKRDMTQKQLAEIISTKQSAIARAENGHDLPTWNLLQKIAVALQMILLPPKLIPTEDIEAFMISSNTKGADGKYFVNNYSVENYRYLIRARKSKVITNYYQQL